MTLNQIWITNILLDYLVSLLIDRLDQLIILMLTILNLAATLIQLLVFIGEHLVQLLYLHFKAPHFSFSLHLLLFKLNDAAFMGLKLQFEAFVFELFFHVLSLQLIDTFHEAAIFDLYIDFILISPEKLVFCVSHPSSRVIELILDIWHRFHFLIHNEDERQQFIYIEWHLKVLDLLLVAILSEGIHSLVLKLICGLMVLVNVLANLNLRF